MTRKPVVLRDEHENMLEDLERMGVIDRVFGNFNEMVRYFLEQVYENRADPPYLELEMAREKKQKWEERVESLEDDVNLEERKEAIDEELEEHAEKFVEKVEDKIAQSRKSFQEQYEEWEDGRIRKFSRDNGNISQKKFREECQKKARKRGFELEF
jgi:hypothetical protein